MPPSANGLFARHQLVLILAPKGFSPVLKKNPNSNSIVSGTPEHFHTSL